MSECIGEDERVQILLSTYNGARYLKEQLESYRSMERFSQCRVLIRDDGSTDGTQNILREYEKYKDFHIEFGSNIGLISSYERLIQNSDRTCDYFALSDQDDVWMPDKLSKALPLLAQCPADKIALFASRSRITNERLVKIGTSSNPKRGLSYYNAMIQNVLPGHTQIFNRTMRDCLAKQGFPQAEGVDWWFYLLAGALGTIVFEPSPTVLHRQHKNNAVGYQLGIWGSLKKKLNYIRQGKGSAISRQILSFFRLYGARMPEEFRLETELFLNSLPSLPKRWAYLQSCKVFRQNKNEDWKFRLLYLLGKYKIPVSEAHGELCG